MAAEGSNQRTQGLPFSRILAPIATGPERLFRQVAKDEQGTKAYGESLDAVRGQCIVCRIHGLDVLEVSASTQMGVYRREEGGASAQST